MLLSGLPGMCDNRAVSQRVNRCSERWRQDVDAHEPEASQAMLAAARALFPQIAAAADEIERERRLPQPLFEALTAAGLMRMVIPRSLGGGECDPETIM